MLGVAVRRIVSVSVSSILTLSASRVEALAANTRRHEMIGILAEDRSVADGLARLLKERLVIVFSFQDESSVLNCHYFARIHIYDDAGPRVLHEGQLTTLLYGLNDHVWHIDEQRLLSKLIRVARNPDSNDEIFTLVRVRF